MCRALGAPGGGPQLWRMLEGRVADPGSAFGRLEREK